MAATVVAAMSGVVVAMQAAGATTGSGTVIAPPSSFRNHTILIIGSSGISSGAVQVEAANDPNDANTWAPIGGGPVSAVASADLAVTFTGIFQFLRARISTTIGGGTVTVNYQGAKSY